MSANIGAVAAGTTLSPLAPASVMGGLPRYVGAGSTARVRPFPLYKVQLGDGLFSEKRARMLNFARLHNERRFLVLFNNVACRPNPGRTDADASGPSTIGGAALPAPVRGDDGAEVAVRGNASSASATAYVLPAGVARAVGAGAHVGAGVDLRDLDVDPDDLRGLPRVQRFVHVDEETGAGPRRRRRRGSGRRSVR